MSAEIAKDHHFAPIFYLGAWAGDDGRVIRYSRPHDAVVAKSCAPKRLGSEAHLYTLQGVSPNRQAALETEFFSPVDSRAAIAHRKLIEGGIAGLSPAERVDWARFLLSTQLRNPFGLGEVERLADSVMRQTMQVDDAEFNALRKEGDPDNIYDWTAKHQPYVITNAPKTFLPAMIDNPELGGYLINMHWGLADVRASRHALLTGDRPLIYTHGWKDPQTALLFPVSPNLLFIATNGARQLQKALALAPDHLASFTNGQVVTCAVDFVVGRDGSQLRFVENRLRRIDQPPIPGPVGKGRLGCPA